MAQLTHIPPPPIQIKGPKPIFVIKFDPRHDAAELQNAKNEIYKSELAKDYHVLVLTNTKDEDSFEMFNADKIERQEWNKLVTKITK